MKMITRIKQYLERRRARKFAWRRMHYWKNKRDRAHGAMIAIVAMYPDAVKDQSSPEWELFTTAFNEHERLSKIAKLFENKYNKLL